MSAVGLDIGSDSLVVAVVRHRAVDVLQNEVGKRNTPSLVAFAHKRRLMGEQALAQFSSNGKNTVKFIRRFIGRKYDEAETKEESKYITYKVEKAKNEEVQVEVDYDGKKQHFSPVQITAGLLSRCKMIAEQGSTQKIHDVVIGIPPYFTQHQRRAVVDAALISGLNVLRLMHENTAVALTYGILRPLPEKETQYVLFIDFGLCSYYATLVAFKEGKELQVIATDYDTQFGARNFDQLLVQHFASEIQTKYKLDVLSDPKATLKLQKECERVKSVLSANSVVEWNVEYIMNDRDVGGVIERTTFESLITTHFTDKFLAPIKRVFEAKAVTELKITKDTIHSVEIVGGGSRIPVVQKILKEYLGKDLSKTCDGDESVARGCALQCAILSPHIRVREFAVHDIYPEGVAEKPEGGALTSEELKTSIDREAQILNQDRLIEETEEARNALESYALEMRNKIADEKDLAPYIKDATRETFTSALSKIEEWLEDDGMDAPKKEYVKRLEEAKKTGDPVVKRKKEEETRPEAIASLKAAIGKYTTFAESKEDKYSHISEEDKKKVQKAAGDADEWLVKMLIAQDRIPKHDDPVLATSAIKDQLTALKTLADPIMKKPKPKPKKEKKDETKKDETKKDETKKDETKKDETKKDETKKDETKKDETKEDEAKTDEAKNGEKKKDEEQNGGPAEEQSGEKENQIAEEQKKSPKKGAKKGTLKKEPKKEAGQAETQDPKDGPQKKKKKVAKPKATNNS